MPEWHQTAASVAQGLLLRLKALSSLLEEVWRERSHYLQTWYARAAGVFMLVLLAITGVTNVWGVASINTHLLPKATHAASTALQREVDLGRLRWLLPTGLAGMGPVASIGPVRVGPGTVEGSSAVLPEVKLHLQLLPSLLSRRLMLQVQADRAQVALVQNDNFSWFGYPNDTMPSCRDMLPGLRQEKSAAAIKEEPAAAASEPVLRAEQLSPQAAANFRPAIGPELVQLASQHAAARRSKAKAEAGKAPEAPGGRAQAAEADAGPGDAVKPSDSAFLGSQEAEVAGAGRERVAEEAATRTEAEEGSKSAALRKQKLERVDSREAAVQPSAAPQSAALQAAEAAAKSAGFKEQAVPSSSALAAPEQSEADAACPAEATRGRLQAEPALPKIPAGGFAQSQFGQIASQVGLKAHHEDGPEAAYKPPAGQGWSFLAGSSPVLVHTTGETQDTIHAPSFQDEDVLVAEEPQAPPQAGWASEFDIVAEPELPTLVHVTPHEDLWLSQAHEQEALGRAAASPSVLEEQEASTSGWEGGSGYVWRERARRRAISGERRTMRSWMRRKLSAAYQLQPRMHPADAAAHIPTHLDASAFMLDGGVSSAVPRLLRGDRQRIDRAERAGGRTVEEDTSAAQQPSQQATEAEARREEVDAEAPPPPSTRKRKRRRRAAAASQAPRELQLSASELGPDDGRLPTEQKLGPKLQWSNRRAALESSPPPAIDTASPEPEQAWWHRRAEQLSRQLSALFHSSRDERNDSHQAGGQAPKQQHEAIRRAQPGKKATPKPMYSGPQLPFPWRSAAPAERPAAPATTSENHSPAAEGAREDGKVPVEEPRDREDRTVQEKPSRSFKWERLRQARRIIKAQPDVLAAKGLDVARQSRTPKLDPAPSEPDAPPAAQPATEADLQTEETPPEDSRPAELEQPGVEPQAQEDAECLREVADVANEAAEAVEGFPQPAQAVEASVEGPTSRVGPMPAESEAEGQVAADQQLSKLTISEQAADVQPAEEGGEGLMPRPPSPDSLAARASSRPSRQPPPPEPRLSKPKQRTHVSKRPRLEEDTGPRYKPGTPASGVRGGVGAWLATKLAPLAARLPLPAVHVDTVRIKGGNLAACMAGEPIPRRITNVDFTIKLGSQYRSLTMDVAGNAYERDNASNRCTMTASEPVRHLRDTPSWPLANGPAAVPAAPSGQLPAEQDQTSATHEKKRERRGWGRKNSHVSKPTGGRIKARVRSSNLHLRYPDTHVQVWGTNLHAPMAERVLELPIDAYSGRLDGELRMHAHDAATWRLPLFGGRVKCSKLAFHFWDATDDFSDANMDLVFEGRRLYLHAAAGRFGAVPMTITGDMDLDPATGEYRFTASVPGVEVNDLRRTLGIRPLPLAIGGAVRGVLHCSGPLEQPVFSGTAVALPPPRDAVASMEDCNAKDTLQAEPAAAGAYDRIPLAAASAVFTLDTSTDLFVMHSLQVEPLDGGQLVGSGRMWVNPIAEHDPRAVRVTMRGSGLPFEPLLLRYLPKGVHLPPSLVLGDGTVRGTLEGSHAAPDIRAAWKLPAADASGTADLSRDSAALTCRAPAVDVSGAVHLVPPDPDAVKRAVTQREASALATPVIDGLELDAGLKGLDVLPLAMPPEALERLHSGTPLRLKLSGRVKFSGGLDRALEGSGFSGDLSLDSLRVNQLKLTRNLAGHLRVGEDSFQVQAKGSRPDEALEANVKLPLFEAIGSPTESATPRTEPTPGPFGIYLGDLLPRSGPETNVPPSSDGGGRFSLRCGQLLMSGEVNKNASLVGCQVQGLKLDELELGSLRGDVQEASLRLDLEARQGRGQVAVQGPRFSGVQGESLSTSVRWERDVVRLERANLQQERSRYEVQGEYVIPASVAIPRSAASMALPPRDPDAAAGWSPFQSSAGRWRIQVNVPGAQMEEILPAARLLSRAASPAPSDYQRAKAAFLSGVQAAAIQARDLGRQLEAAAESARAQLASSLAGDEEEVRQQAGASSRASLPGLQDLKGHWSGTFQAYGGGGGAANVDFDLRGHDWKWGDYALDQALAQGACHSLEGVKIEEVSLRAGDAKLLIRGRLLNEAQDASVLLTDFPVALLQPLFRSMPALQHAAPAAGSGGIGGNGSGSGFSGLAMPFTSRGGDRADTPASPAAASARFADSPVNGLLYVRGVIGGSARVPEGELVVRLFEGAIGPTRLAQAQAQAALDAAQRLRFGMDLAPLEPRPGGFARVTGSLPLHRAATPGVEEGLECSLHVRDGGMKLVRILTPGFRWQAGLADIRLKLHGRRDDLALDGGMHISRAVIASPFLKYPLTNMTATVNLADNIVQVEQVEAKVGRRGFVRAKGDLPLSRPTDGRRPRSRWNAIVVDARDLELRLRNVYTGFVDASLRVRNSLTEPVVGGDVRLSRGTATLAAQAGPADSERSPEPARDGDFFARAFTALSRQDAAAAIRLPQLQGQESEVSGMASMQLQGLQVRLGPELRAMYPVVVNMGISGALELSGPADPAKLRLNGVVHLESGEINLVAAQLMLDREHSNRLVFEGKEGLDPVVDLSLRGAQIRAVIQGRASTWHRHLVLMPITTPAGETAEQLQPSEAARIFEGQLASALVAEDGQLALSNLAVSAAHGFMPKIQTQGQLGQARWRLVSAPSIPGLLSLDPSGDPTSLLSSLTMGTEVEVQFGNSLQAAMARKLRDSDIATQWTLTYQLNSKLRMQFTVASTHPYPRTLLFQYSGDSS